MYRPETCTLNSHVRQLLVDIIMFYIENIIHIQMQVNVIYIFGTDIWMTCLAALKETPDNETTS